MSALNERAAGVIASASIDARKARNMRAPTRGSRVRSWAAIILVVAVGVSSGTSVVAARAEGSSSQVSVSMDATDFSDSSDVVPEGDRDREVGPDWRESGDLAWTVAGDAHALRILVADSSEGFAWRQLAALAVAGVETDQWIGNACLSTDGSTLAVVYGPRSFANRQDLASRGGSAALVNVGDGSIKELAGGYSLSYFNPTCGVDGWVSFTQFSDEWQTRVVSLSAQHPDTDRIETLSPAFVTSAVMGEQGLLGAIQGAVVTVAEDGGTDVVAETVGTPYQIVPSDNGLGFVQPIDKEQSEVRFIPADAGEPQLIARGKADSVGLVGDAEGAIHAIAPRKQIEGELPDGVVPLPDGEPGGDISSGGRLLVQSSAAKESTTQSDVSEVQIDALSTVSGNERTFRTDVTLEGVDLSDAEIDPQQDGGLGPAPAYLDARPFEAPLTSTGMSGPQPASVTAGISPTNPTSSDSPCAVPRNDPKNQALQPRPAQVEWAVDRAVQGALTSSRPANWMNMGMAAYTPQGMFPAPTLSGGGRVPAPILLGILAQESNLTQASPFTVPGVTGNPLIGNYYGISDKTGDAEGAGGTAWWNISWSDADCGYGVGQVTTGMRAGEMPYAQQRAIAVDYEANIARSLQILAEKWNTTRAAGLVVNDGNPKYMENWFFALWVYNTPWHPKTTTDAPWGVGWFNNPANPIYPFFRKPFLDATPADAAQPQSWPYPEKVLGFAAYSVLLLDHVDQNALADDFSYQTAFSSAWWRATDNNDGKENRRTVKPPVDTFCNSSNNCNILMAVQPDDPDEKPGPCLHKDSAGKYDLLCYFNKPVAWKSNCSVTCGYEGLGYSLNAARPADATSFPAAPSNCNSTGLPSNALIIDDLPSGTLPVRPMACAPVASAGSFVFSFTDDGTGRYPSKVDLHQLGAGLNAHFYLTHTRVPNTPNGYGGKLNIKGKWTLGQAINGWAQVYVHMPNHGAWAQQARYSVYTGSSTVTRSINQRNYANVWVPLGAMQFSGTPSISLSNSSSRYAEGSGLEDIAWDAVAFVPLPNKPEQFVVALGDSYSSGEGTAQPDGTGFFRSSDNNGQDSIFRNACHRSQDAWAYKMSLPTLAPDKTVRDLVYANDPRLDFQLLACSGAIAANVRTSTNADGFSTSRFGEDNQLDRGFVDTNTTLVTISIGGNDVGFGPIIQTCILVQSGDCANDINASNKTIPPDYPANASKKLVTAMPYILENLRKNVEATLAEIHGRAPNARVLLLGYPTLFESYTSACIDLKATAANRDWLNGVARDLSRTLTAAAQNAGGYVTYQSPQYQFAGKNLCTTNPAINGLMWKLTPGDNGIDIPLRDPYGRVGASAQGVHPNVTGTSLYASVATQALDSVRIPVASSLVGAAGTTYYSTFRLHAGGPAAFNVRSFSQCGGEIRFGLRTSTSPSTDTAMGQQHTASLSWTKPNDMQTFTRLDNGSPNLAAGWYALNARLVNACTGGGSQPWAGDLFW
jgi:hypothetical protein